MLETTKEAVKQLGRLPFTLCAALLAWALLAHPSSAQPSAAPEAQAAVDKTAAGAFSEAIQLFESLSDRNAESPDLSYNRAAAYLQRAESPKARDTDLGQAVAALREAQRLGDDSDGTARVIESVREEISRLRARQGKDPVVVQPALGRALLGLLPEPLWAILTLLGTALLSAGLLLRRADPVSQKRLIGQVLTGVGLIALVGFGIATWRAREYRVSSQEAVVVAPDARLLDGTGTPLKAKALDSDATSIPQGAYVFVVTRQGQLVNVEWGSVNAWVRGEQVRVLAPHQPMH